MLNRVCNNIPDIICVPIFVIASLQGHSTTCEPQCNQKQMQTLIMQANVHRLASLIASHQQRAYRTYGAVRGVGGDIHANAAARWQPPLH